MESDKLIIKFIWKIKHVRIGRNTLKEKNHEWDELYWSLKHIIKVSKIQQCGPVHKQTSRPWSRI